MANLPSTTDTGLVALAAARSRHNEEQVLADRALENERRVAIVRLATFFMLGVSQGIISNVAGKGLDSAGGVRPVVLVCYLVFCVVSIVMTQRSERASVRKATWIPFFSATVDVCFVVAMNWADQVNGELQLDGTAVMLALTLAYAILRFGDAALGYAVVVAVVAFAVVLGWAGPFDWPRFTFTSFVLVAIGFLLWWTRRAVRQAFVDLKRREGLSRLLPQKVVDEILAGREEVLRPTRRNVTVLFSDIRDFTTFSEGREPEEVLRVLDEYFGRMTQIVQGHDGSVNKFIGDGLLAVWGAPGKLDDHAAHAARAALDMQRSLDELNQQRVRDGQLPLRIGVGLHSGPVAAGMLGGGGQSEFTVIGDAVNLASRIEGLTKQFGVEVLVSDDTWRRLGDRFAGVRHGEATVKGRKAAVVVWSLTGPRVDAPAVVDQRSP
jgi:adenylate cyclase